MRQCLLVAGGHIYVMMALVATSCNVPRDIVPTEQLCPCTFSRLCPRQPVTVPSSSPVSQDLDLLGLPACRVHRSLWCILDCLHLADMLSEQPNLVATLSTLDSEIDFVILLSLIAASLSSLRVTVAHGAFLRCRRVQQGAALRCARQSGLQAPTRR